MPGSPLETLPWLCVHVFAPSGSELASLPGVPHRTTVDGPQDSAADIDGCREEALRWLSRRQATLKPLCFTIEVFSFWVTVKLGQALLRLGIQTLRRVEG